MEASDLTVDRAEGWMARVRRPRFSLLEAVGLLLVVAALVALLWFRGAAAEARLERFRSLAYQSPLPDVQVAGVGEVPDTAAFEQRYDFTTDWVTGKIPVWEAVLAPFKGRPGVHYLEVGLYEGRSALWMLENILTHPTSHLTGIDVFQGALKERYLANIKRSGAADKVTTITGYSQVALRGLPLDSFDIIYIDGSHAEDAVLEDAVLSWRLLKRGGVLIFDDYRWAGCFEPLPLTDPTTEEFAKIAIDRFVQSFDDQLDVIHNSRQLIVRKKAAP